MPARRDGPRGRAVPHLPRAHRPRRLGRAEGRLEGAGANLRRARPAAHGVAAPQRRAGRARRPWRARCSGGRSSSHRGGAGHRCQWARRARRAWRRFLNESVVSGECVGGALCLWCGSLTQSVLSGRCVSPPEKVFWCEFCSLLIHERLEDLDFSKERLRGVSV